MWEQDGVAPQCPIDGLSKINRVYIPAEVKKGFLESHTIVNYDWIFKLNKYGHVNKRN